MVVLVVTCYRSKIEVGEMSVINDTYIPTSGHRFDQYDLM